MGPPPNEVPWVPWISWHGRVISGSLLVKYDKVLAKHCIPYTTIQNTISRPLQRQTPWIFFAVAVKIHPLVLFIPVGWWVTALVLSGDRLTKKPGLNDSLRFVGPTTARCSQNPKDPCMVYMLTFWGTSILMVNVTIYSIHGSYGEWNTFSLSMRCCAEIHIAQALQDGFLALDPNHLHRSAGPGYWEPRPQTMRLS